MEKEVSGCRWVVGGSEEGERCSVQEIGSGSRAKMVRARYCKKMGVKKRPWTTEEDQILVAYI
ncbi:hypothetical protein EJ110_NYTH56978 [Nymphaea thermarum]|nr:hypothetical protein EJ110_NYTH56978 [Nymphaea thermarum]